VAPDRAWGNAVPGLAQAAELKRASIVRAAAQCFSRLGFHGTSMDDIAGRLGVTKAALYRYVSNKHELLLESFNLAMDSSFANLDRAEAEGRNGLDKLQIALRGYLADLIGKLGHPVVLLEENALLPAQSRAIIARRDAVERRYRGLVEEGIRDGSIVPCSPKLAVFALLGAVNWVPKWYRTDGAWSADQVAESLVSLVTRSLAAIPEPPRKERATLS
jgi:TetR/AcrR family transcriptional regulator